MRRKQVSPGSPARAVVYLRASTEKQDLSPDAQRAACARWAAAHGARVVATFEDLDVSGAAPVDERPGLLAAVEALRVHGAGVLLVAKRDRLARDVVVAAMVERLAERQGARILSADGTGNGDGPEAQLMRGIVDVFAQYERAVIRARTRAALAVKRTRGEKTGGAVPYGKRLAADGVHLEPDPAGAAVVARVRALRTRGRTLRAVAARLEAEGFKPRGGGRWHPQTVANIDARAVRSKADNRTRGR